MSSGLGARQLSLVVVCVLLGAVGGLLLKAGAVRIDYGDGAAAALRQALTEPRLLCGVLLYAVPLVGYVLLLKTVPLSVLQPLLALTYVVTPLLALAFFDEHVPAGRWAGIAVIVAGVVVVART